MYGQIRWLLTITSLVLLVLFQTGCHPTPASTNPPPAFSCCAKLGSDSYQCETASPGVLVIDGKGAIKVSVVGDNPVQFSQNVTYLPNNYMTPTVVLQNNTNSSGYQKIIYSGTNESTINFDVPMWDSYTIKSYYIEYGISAPPNASTGNTSICFNPVANGCYRWYKFISLPDGTHPNCNHGYSIIINRPDPDGFIGNCN